MPKWYCQMRLTITRAVSGCSGSTSASGPAACAGRGTSAGSSGALVGDQDARRTRADGLALVLPVAALAGRGSASAWRRSFRIAGIVGSGGGSSSSSASISLRQLASSPRRPPSEPLLRACDLVLELLSSSPPSVLYSASGGEDDVVLLRRGEEGLQAVVVLLRIGSNLWSWQRAQPTVRPRNAVPTMSVISVSTSLRLKRDLLVAGVAPHRAEPVEDRRRSGSRGRPGSSSSPASCSVTNRSNGLSRVEASR